MRFVYVMDPLGNVNPQKDTTYAIMQGAARQGHDVVFVPKDGISLQCGEVQFDGHRVMPLKPCGPKLFEDLGAVSFSGNDVDAVFIRTDPPFDATYLMHTWLLDHLPDHILVINDPSGVRTVNEKIWSLQFKEFVPDSIVTSRMERLDGFLARHERIIVKPTDGHGGMGVFLVGQGDTNASVIFETLTHHGQQAVIAQTYVTDAEIGDKRILLLDGQPLGAILRIHAEDDHRNNFFAGGSAQETNITDRDLEIIAGITPKIRALGLHFVGIDVIGEFLIEVNVTSPTCLQEMNQLYDLKLEERVINYVEQHVQRKRGVSSAI